MLILRSSIPPHTYPFDRAQTVYCLARKVILDFEYVCCGQ